MYWLVGTIGINKYFKNKSVLNFSVYLRSTPEIVYERMKARGRKEEAGVPLDYLKRASYKIFLFAYWNLKENVSSWK